METSNFSVAYKKEFWLSHIKSWLQSNQSQVNYCDNNKLNLNVFKYWRARLRSEVPFPDYSKAFVKIGDIHTRSGFASRYRGPIKRSEYPIRFWIGRFCIELDKDFNFCSLGLLVKILEKL